MKVNWMSSNVLPLAIFTDGIFVALLGKLSEKVTLGSMLEASSRLLFTLQLSAPVSFAVGIRTFVTHGIAGSAGISNDITFEYRAFFPISRAACVLGLSIFHCLFALFTLLAQSFLVSL